MSVATRVHFDRSEKKVTFERTQDVEPILERNKALQTTPQAKGSFKHVASIPAVIVERWINEEGLNLLTLPKHEFDRLVRKKLRDPDWQFLKTTDGRV